MSLKAASSLRIQSGWWQAACGFAQVITKNKLNQQIPVFTDALIRSILRQSKSIARIFKSHSPPPSLLHFSAKKITPYQLSKHLIFQQSCNSLPHCGKFHLKELNRFSKNLNENTMNSIYRSCQWS
ncbi:hypothetical protein LPB67_17390 [Undibacterium sp. Jales W-56]|uniref:hypothetical protein n=1 Tax=Undibacterium sp. Jales W-56 TaxID=2897325 RepID=UPI0021D0799B|nr:hypothetical protein [Undibacterium sp. Jales W-56]MCU6435555.1 hypothetical protein [Undibacterium sp. Jales W-56]